MDQASSPSDGLQGTDSHSEWTERLPLALLAAAMAISTWLVLSLNSGLTFINDEWDPLLNRPGWGIDQIFAPFNGHPTMIPMVIYKTVQEVFGMDSTRPVQVVHAALLLVMNGVLFVYLRRRVGDWAALIGTVLVLFLGAAFEILIFSFTMNFTGAIAAGIGALLALDRDDRTGDIVATALLVLGLCISLVVLPFLIAATVEWYLNPRGRTNRIFLPGVPIAFFAVWWLTFGREAGTSSFAISNVLTTPWMAFETFSSGFMSLFGLATGGGNQGDQPNLIWGKLIALAALALAIWRIKVIGRPPPRDLLVSGSALLAFLLILGLSEDEARQPTFSRFQLPVVILILMTASCLLEGVRIKASWLVGGALVALISVQAGVRLWQQEATNQWTVASQYVRTYVTGIELAGRDATPKETMGIGPWVTIAPTRFIAVSNEYGSPALSQAELRNIAGDQLYWLDTGLVRGTGAGLDAEPPDTDRSRCREARGKQAVKVEPGRYRVENATDSEVKVLLARLAPSPAERIGAVLPNSAAGLDLPAGELEGHWKVFFEPASPRVAICGP